MRILWIKRVNIPKSALIFLALLLGIFSIFVVHLSFSKLASYYIQEHSNTLDYYSSSTIMFISLISIFISSVSIIKISPKSILLSAVICIILLGIDGFYSYSYISFIQTNVSELFDYFNINSIFAHLILYLISSTLFIYVLVRCIINKEPSIIWKIFLSAIVLICYYKLLQNLYALTTDQDGDNLFTFFSLTYFCVIAIFVSILFSLVNLLLIHHRSFIKNISSNLGVIFFSFLLNICILTIAYGQIGQTISSLAYLKDNIEDILGFITVSLILLYFIMPATRFLTRKILIKASLISLSIFLAILVYTDITSAISEDISFEKFAAANDFTGSIAFFYHPFSPEYAITLLNLSIVLFSLAIYLVMIYNSLPKEKRFFKKLSLATITAISVLNIVIALCIIYIFPFTHSIGGGRSGGGPSAILVSNLQVISTPKELKEMQVNQPFILTIELVAKNGQPSLNKLAANNKSPLHNIFGNSICASAVLYVDPDKLGVTPSQAREYSLDEQSVRWNWIVTPKQTGKQIIELDIEIIECSGEQTKSGVVTGPYQLSTSPYYDFAVIDPNENIITRTFHSFDPGAIINTGFGGALGAVVAAFIVWIGHSEWKRVKTKPKSAKQRRKKLPQKNSSSSNSKKNRTKDSKSQNP